jgi:multidrug efflux pump subunit AcrA (membrane-fusion protein)
MTTPRFLSFSLSKQRGIGRGALLTAVFAVLVISTGLVYLRAAPKPTEAGQTQPVAALSVTRAAPQWRQWSATIEAAGTIAPWQEAVIGAQLSGVRLTEVRANVGDVVKRGQLLARFDDDMLIADMAQLKANLAQAQATAAQAETNKQRVLKLVNNAGSLSQLQLKYTQVLAPDDGVISARQATLGTVAASGQELFRLIRQNRLEWRGELTAAQMAQIRPGLHINLSLPDGSLAEAALRQLAPTLDPQSRLGIVYADLAPGSKARSGMYAAGQVLLTESPALTVPAASVVIRDGRSYVLKLQNDNPVTPVGLQPVDTGRRQGTEIEIVQGLQEADRVVVEGAGFLNDGDLVQIVQEQNKLAGNEVKR